MVLTMFTVALVVGKLIVYQYGDLISLCGMVVDCRNTYQYLAMCDVVLVSLGHFPWTFTHRHSPQHLSLFDSIPIINIDKKTCSFYWLFQLII